MIAVDTNNLPAMGTPRGQQAKTDIIRAAMELFGEVGFHGASLRDIAARAGMSHPGMLHHFPTKTALLQAVLERRDHEDATEVQAERDTGRTRLQAMIHLMERNSERRPIIELFTALAAEATSPAHPAHGYFLNRYDQLVTVVEDELVQHQQRGQLREGVNPHSAARTIIAVMDGLQLQWLLTTADGSESQFSMADAFRAHLNSLLTCGLDCSPQP